MTEQTLDDFATNNSASLYSTLALTSLLPIGLKLTQDSLRALFADFTVDISQLTILFLNRSTPFVLLVLPFGVIATRLLIRNLRIRNYSYVILATLSIISIVFAGLAFGIPLADEVQG